jgi:Predicted transcriptional regulator with C-terminal CBS domains
MKKTTKVEHDDFMEFYNNDDNVTPDQRARIDFEVELIGKLIEAREAKGFTQEKLAEASGIKQSAIARLESLKTTPQIDTLIKLLTPMGYRLAIVSADEK